MAFFGNLYRDGNTIKQHNNPDPIKIVFIEHFCFIHFLNQEIFKALDLFEQHGINGMRVFGFWPYGKGLEEEPYIRTGTKKYDLNRFNPKFFDYLRQWMDYALEKNIVIRYEVFDRCGLTTREVVSDHHPYNALVGRDKRKFSDLSNTKLLAIQERYVQKVVESLRAYPNVIFGVMNEFTTNKDWHYHMSRLIHKLAPNHLISGSEEGSPAVADPNCDMWWCHTGTYDRRTGEEHVADDIRSLRKRTGNSTILGFSTDGFGNTGKPRENPHDMGNLAHACNNANLQMFAFLDQHIDESQGGALIGKAHLLNAPTYEAIVREFPPTALGDTPVIELPEGVLQATSSRRANCNHTQAFIDSNGRAVRATMQHGFLFWGNYQKGYPSQQLLAVFNVFIDNNTYDDAYIAIIDVVKDRSKVVAHQLLKRSDFPEAGKHIKLTLPFTSDGPEHEYETRVWYLGFTYLAVDGTYIIDPFKIAPDVLPDRVPTRSNGGTNPPPQPPPNTFCNNTAVCIDSFTEQTVKAAGGKIHGATLNNGTFEPTKKGGIELQTVLDFDKGIVFEFYLQNDIINEHLEEQNGGKVSILDATFPETEYFLSIQRMYNGYRGEGIFRVMHGYGSEHIARVITVAALSGHYSMKGWGKEPHVIRLEVRKERCRLSIDDYVSSWGSGPRPITGQRNTQMMIGNRLGRHSSQHAITQFTQFRIVYTS